MNNKIQRLLETMIALGGLESEELITAWSVVDDENFTKDEKELACLNAISILMNRTTEED